MSAEHDPLDKAVALLKTIGLDITYTDEGLRVVAEQIGRLYVNAPRILTADDPEPAVGSVVLDTGGDAWQRVGDPDGHPYWYSTFGWRGDWTAVPLPARLIHDGEATP